MIECHLRFRPYSLEKKVLTLIPGTRLALEVKPEHYRIFDPATLKTLEEKTLPALSKQAVFLDLEKMHVEITGFGQDGFFRTIIPGGEKPYTRERLSLGVHKAQDATMIFRRKKPEEIFPILFFLSQSISFEGGESPFSINGFESLFYPESIASITAAYGQIRRLFFQEEEGQFFFLCEKEPPFHAGRLVDVRTKAGHRVAFEWRKKTCRQVEMLAATNSHYQFNFSSSIKRFRLHTQQGVVVLTNGAMIELEKGKTYLLDRFEK